MRSEGLEMCRLRVEVLEGRMLELSRAAVILKAWARFDSIPNYFIKKCMPSYSIELTVV